MAEGTSDSNIGSESNRATEEPATDPIPETRINVASFYVF